MRVNISLEQLIFPRANPATAMPAFHSTHLSLNIWIKCCFAWISIFVAGLVHMHCNPHGQPHTRACTKCFKMTVKVPLCFPISSPQPVCPKWITSFLKNKKIKQTHKQTRFKHQMEPKAQCKLELRGAFSGVLRVYKPYLSFSDGLWLWQKMLGWRIKNPRISDEIN